MLFGLIGNYGLQFADDFSYTDSVSLNLITLRNLKTWYLDRFDLDFI